jgi:hypothetical protein
MVMTINFKNILFSVNRKETYCLYTTRVVVYTKNLRIIAHQSKVERTYLVDTTSLLLAHQRKRELLAHQASRLAFAQKGQGRRDSVF